MGVSSLRVSCGRIWCVCGLPLCLGHWWACTVLLQHSWNSPHILMGAVATCSSCTSWRCLSWAPEPRPLAPSPQGRARTRTCQGLNKRSEIFCLKINVYWNARSCLQMLVGLKVDSPKVLGSPSWWREATSQGRWRSLTTGNFRNLILFCISLVPKTAPTMSM